MKNITIQDLKNLSKQGKVNWYKNQFLLPNRSYIVKGKELYSFVKLGDKPIFTGVILN